MLRWDSYRTVYGAELRAAAREYTDHGWPVVEAVPAGLLLATGTSLDVLEVPAAVGRLVCAQLRAAGMAVPVLVCLNALEARLGSQGLGAQLAVGLLPLFAGIGAYVGAAWLLGLTEVGAILAAIRRQRPAPRPEP